MAGNEEALALIGLDMEAVERWDAMRKKRGRRDARVCVCGHSGNAHFPVHGSAEDIGDLPAGEVGCQAGKVPCQCDQFKWVLTIGDVRSFIQKTEGPGPLHALAKGIASSAKRGHFPEWREGIVCFMCKRDPAEVGQLIPIAYNERGGEAMRSTSINRMHCEECRLGIQQQVSGARP